MEREKKSQGSLLTLPLYGMISQRTQLTYIVLNNKLIKDQGYKTKQPVMNVIF
jgi:hypothetical protein